MVARPVAVLLGLLALAGCGDSGPSKAAFVRAADTICAGQQRASAAPNAQLSAIRSEPDARRAYQSLAAATDAIATADARATDRLDAAVTPDGDRDEIKAWIADRRRADTARRKLAAAYQAGDDGSIARLAERIDVLTRRSQAFAAGFGLRTCAR